MKRTIDAQDNAKLVDRVTVRTCYMTREALVKADLAPSNRARLWASSLTSYGDVIGHCLD
ncbi:hypothetical protein DES53_102357 [Roseimicrobium gellanilyticum]|uniref:Uncharacterized protein n=1 Tax=Roseimicrobium gellanilyticum TaxID=748857 RepID=A0A366HQN6_9BACT|nr:hypothetical protein DES53_102357 [Roseimicrobium gellanilyticum]